MSSTHLGHLYLPKPEKEDAVPRSSSLHPDPARHASEPACRPRAAESHTRPSQGALGNTKCFCFAPTLAAVLPPAVAEGTQRRVISAVGFAERQEAKPIAETQPRLSQSGPSALRQLPRTAPLPAPGKPASADRRAGIRPALSSLSEGSVTCKGCSATFQPLHGFLSYDGDCQSPRVQRA